MPIHIKHSHTHMLTAARCAFDAASCHVAHAFLTEVRRVGTPAHRSTRGALECE